MSRARSRPAGTAPGASRLAAGRPRCIRLMIIITIMIIIIIIMIIIVIVIVIIEIVVVIVIVTVINKDNYNCE